MSSFRLAIINLVRRKIPTVIALASISISVGSSGVLLRLYLLSNSRFSSLALGPDAIIGAKASGMDLLLGSLNLEGPYPGFIPYVLYSSIAQKKAVQFEDGAKAVPSYVKAVVPILYFANYKEYRVLGTDEAFIHRPSNSNPVTVHDGAWVAAVDEAVVGSDVARREGLRVGDSIGVNGVNRRAQNQSAFSLKVVGILNPTGKSTDSGVYTTLNQAWKALQSSDLLDQSIWKQLVLSYFLVYVEPDGIAPLEALINQRSVAQVIRVEPEVRRLLELTGTGRKIGFLVSALILFLGGLGVTAMMVTRFDAMTTQLAVLRALGYEKKEIRGWLLWEGALLGMAACLIGALLDLALFPILRGLLGTALPPIQWSGISILQSAPVWIVAVLGTSLAVFIPLYRLYHQDVHYALKS